MRWWGDPLKTMSEITEKIKKLLRMRRGGTAAEVETALRLAQELAAKHGIDLALVDPEEDPARFRITHHETRRSARIQWECKYAGMVADQFFNVTVFTCRSWSGHRLIFVGAESDIQIALYVYNFLVGHFRREWNTRRGRCRHRQAFMYGMYIGLCSKLFAAMPKSDSPSAPGIIRLEQALVRRKEYIHQQFGSLTQNDVRPDGNAQASEQAGFVAGRQTEIRKGVNRPDESRLIGF